MAEGAHIEIPISSASSWEAAARYVAENFCPKPKTGGAHPAASETLLRDQNRSHIAGISYSEDDSAPKAVDHRFLSKVRQWYYGTVEIFVDTQAFCPSPEPEVIEAPILEPIVPARPPEPAIPEQPPAEIPLIPLPQHEEAPQKTRPPKREHKPPVQAPQKPPENPPKQEEEVPL